ncbi:MAG: lysophospholipid acyltransferase family protein [Pseudomonadota bacterium]
MIKTVLSALRSMLFYPIFYGVSTCMVIVAVIALPFGRNPLQRVVRRWAAWHRWCVRWILSIKVVVEGELATGPVLYVIKHESFFEAIDTPSLLRWPAVFTKRELFDIPGWGRAALIYGLVPVSRDGGASALRQMLAAARKIVADGRPLVLFPEGTRVPHGESPAMRSGFAGIYKLVKLPVVPIAVNSGPLYQGWIKRPGMITYKIGEIVPPGLSREEAEARVHAAMNVLN